MDFLVKSPNKMIGVLDELKENAQPLYLFGAGNCGKDYLNVLGEYGIEVEAFFDDDPRKQARGLCGKKVLPPEEMIEREGLILISVACTSPQLLIRRLERISPDLLKRIRWADFILWENGLDYYAYYTENANELEKVYGLLEDERSRTVFRNLLNYKISRDVRLIEEINDLSLCDQYFDMSILRFGQDEVFVDLGAYTGDTVNSFIKNVRAAGGSYAHIYAFEPNMDNFLELKKNTENYPNIACINKGTHSENTVLKFSPEWGHSSCFSENGDIEVPVCSLDTEIDSKVTFIKADIEGSELETLRGAENLIQAYKPTLAFCIYHKKEDIFRIPLYLHELNKNYKFYMRHYSEIPIESVVYAIDSDKI
ncbi:FkbM family methyltransferase [Selenomonas artemidis]|jgi:methyltransferase, fkbM family|uniref:Methyltransferase, FkbM family n=1 Tax=Selenomonas artemidis F0399 TaxID=749551 RepID=E7N3A0_9FIRM|nr:FkbM family methyltransferase [Selenomonas artemidis]EFW29375.1 methyltransferase, FkbM family [Selenomonas artemidis F0399]